MKSLLIKDTTPAERAQIVREALGDNVDCEGIDLTDMYDENTFSEHRLQNAFPFWRIRS